MSDLFDKRRLYNYVDVSHNNNIITVEIDDGENRNTIFKSPYKHCYSRYARSIPTRWNMLYIGSNIIIYYYLSLIIHVIIGTFSLVSRSLFS